MKVCCLTLRYQDSPKFKSSKLTKPPQPVLLKFLHKYISYFTTPLESSLSLLLISDVSDGEVDRDDDGFSPQPTNVHFNGSDGGYLEVPPEGMSAPPPTNKMSLPGKDTKLRS